MKPVYAIPLTTVVTTVVGQNFNSGSFSGTVTFTVSGSAVTVGGTNAATFTVGSSTITVGGASSTSEADATVTASSDSDSADSDVDADSDDGSSSAESEDDDSVIDGFISTYSGSLLTLPLSSSTITLGYSYAPSAGFGGFPFNATITKTIVPSSSGGADTGGNGGGATATPSGPSTSPGIITAVPTATSTGNVRSFSTVLMLLGTAITWLLW